MRVVDTILDAATESGIGENWCLLENQTAFVRIIRSYRIYSEEAPWISYLYLEWGETTNT